MSGVSMTFPSCNRIRTLSLVAVNTVLPSVTVIALILGITLTVPKTCVNESPTEIDVVAKRRLTGGRGCESGPDRDGCLGRSRDLGHVARPCEASIRECCDEGRANVPDGESGHHHDGPGPDRTRNARMRKEECGPTM